MSWIELTEDDALSVVNSPLLSAARQSAIADGQPDPLLEKLAQTISDVRGAVIASGRYVIGAGDTIPQMLKGTALDLFAVRLLGRLDLEISEVKMKLYESAERKIKAVSDGSWGLDVPLAVSAEPTNTPRLRIKPRCRRYRREDGDGA